MAVDRQQPDRFSALLHRDRRLTERDDPASGQLEFSDGIDITEPAVGTTRIAVRCAADESNVPIALAMQMPTSAPLASAFEKPTVRSIGFCRKSQVSITGVHNTHGDLKMKIVRTRIKAAVIALCTAGLAGHALADEFLDAAKQKVAIATMSQEKWDGPTTGPKAAARGTIVFVAGDVKNGSIVGVSKGVEEVGKAIGWNVRVIDGQGSMSGRTAALNQALALKPAG